VAAPQLLSRSAYPGTPDSGTYKYYAGPVTVAGRGHCVVIYGQIDDPYYGLADGGTINPDHCK
jgi:hypothetical protein